MDERVDAGAFGPGPLDQELQRELERQGVEPMLCRYEQVGNGGLRGVAVSPDGKIRYFVWADPKDGEALLVPASGDNVMELTKLAATLPFGFERGGKSLGSGLPGPESEESSVAHQDERARSVHPGATASASGPDDPGVGQDWHAEEPEPEEEEEKPKDDFEEKVASLRDASARLRRATMRVVESSPLEERFLRSELKKSAGTGQPMTPQERARYEKWKVETLRKAADRLAGKARDG